MIYLEYFLSVRWALLWSNRTLPSYLGPSHAQLILLFIFSTVNSITLFALAVMLVRNIWILGSNVTTIEGWEIERHENLVRRANTRGGYLDGPDGMRIRITKQEFPYDVDPGSSWPPPDPERMLRRRYKIADMNPFTYGADASGLDVQGFRERQNQDALRFANGRDNPIGPTSFLRGGENSPQQDTDDEQDNVGTAPTWRDSAGEQLQDFGVEEDAEWIEEDNIPLGELLRYRKSAQIQEGLEDHLPTIVSPLLAFWQLLGPCLIVVEILRQWDELRLCDIGLGSSPRLAIIIDSSLGPHAEAIGSQREPENRHSGRDAAIRIPEPILGTICTMLCYLIFGGKLKSRKPPRRTAWPTGSTSVFFDCPFITLMGHGRLGRVFVD
ncbi:MAG: hypothetical protein Q9212_005566 [Teloschistes hypoglaucus]